MKSLFLILPFILLYSCGENKPNSNTDSEIYSIETFENARENWGYKILNEGNLFINQPHIPAIQGNKGFKSSNDAEKAANLIIYKLEAGIIPPTITVEELDSLGVLN